MQQSSEAAIARCESDCLFQATLTIFKLLVQKSDLNSCHSNNSREENVRFIGFDKMEFDAILNGTFSPNRHYTTPGAYETAGKNTAKSPLVYRRLADC